jgi:hypothetical protein
MRPGYLGNLDNYWFGGKAEEKKIGKMAKVTMSRLTPSAGAARFKAHVFLKKHPLLRARHLLRYKQLGIEGPRDLKIPLSKAPKGESVVDEYYRPGEDTSDADDAFRSPSW